MKRFLAVTLGLVLGATAVTASAQGYSRGRDEGGARGEAREISQGGNRDDAGRGDGNRVEGSDGDRGGRGEGGGNRGGNRGDANAQRQPTQGFAVPSGDGPSNQGQSRGGNYGLAGQLQGGRQDSGYRGDNRGNRDDNWGNGRGDGGWSNNDRRHGNYNDRRWNNNDRRWDYNDRSRWHNGNRHYGGDRRWTGNYSWRNSWNNSWSGNRYRASSRYYYPRGYSSRLSWSIGFRLPSAFYGSSYYVDYRPYGLAPPPYGYRWIRADGDLLLVDLSNGEVVDVINDFYY